MNKIYKLVWSKVRNAWVVASEIAKGHGKNASAARERKLLKTAVITAIMGGCLMTGGLASAALTAEQQAVYDAVMAKLEERGGNHYVSVNPLKKEQTADSNYENNGAKGDGGIAIGEDATSQGRGIAMGYKSKAVPKTGATANLNAFEGIAIGQEADMEVPGGIAIGLRSKVEGTLNTKDGEVNVNELGTIALGTDSYAKGNGAAAFGWKAKGNGEGAMAFGTETKAKESGTAFGGHADAAAGGVAVGWQAHAHDLWAMSIGTSSDAKGKYSTALGGSTTAEAVGSTAVGFATVSKGVLSTAVGAQSVAEEPGSVALGADSVANTKAGKIGYIATGSSVTFEDALKTLNKKEDYDKWTAKVNESKAEYDNLTKAFEDAPTKDKKAEAKAALDAWKGQHADFIEALTKKEKLEATWRATKAAVSVGADGVDKAGNKIIESRQITNVAAGTQDTDAVNVAQLKALNTKVEGNKIHYLSIGPDNEKNLAQDGNYNNDGADSHWGIAIGVNASSKGGGSIAIGKGSQAHGTEEHRAQGVSIGSASRAIGAFATAVGHDTKAFGEYSVAYGLGDAYGRGSIAIGSGAVAALKEGITKEEYNKLSDEEKAWYGKADYDAQKIFYQFRHKGKDGKVEDIKNYGMAIGSGATSFDNAGLAVGLNAKTNKDFGVALGAYAENKVEQGVALGTSSVADRAKDVKGYLPTTGKAIENFEEAMKATGKEAAFKELNGKYLAAQEKLAKAQEAYNADQSPTNMMNLDKAQKELKGLTEEYAVMTAPWTSRRGAVSVGNDKTGFTRQIIGVAAGSEDTDAVNVAQLKALNTKVDKGAIHYYSVTSDKKAAGSNFDNDGAKGTDSMVIGIGSSSEAENSTVLGNNNTLKRYNADQNGSSSRNNIVVGQNMEVEGAHNAVFGTDYQNNLENRKTMVAGKHNTVIGVGNLAGYTAEKDPQNRFKWIYSKVENGSDSGNVVVGMNNTATRGSLVIGSESEATSSGISVGNHNKVVSDEDFGVALGSDLVVDGYQALAIGSKSEAKADYTVAIGGGALAEKENSIAFGNEAKAQNNYSVAIGSFAKATARSGVALGSSSLADREKGAIGYLAGEETSEVWKATQGAVSVGNKEKKYTRQITGVAAGTEDTDAVNVAQLKALNTKVDKGAIHYFSVKSDDSANPAGTNWNNDGATGQDAVAIGKNAAASGKSAFATGWKSKAAGYSDIAIGREAEATGGWGVAIGQSAKAQASTAVAMAYAAEAKGANSLAIGVQSEAKTNDSTAYGREAKALGDVALAVGAKTKAEGNHSSVFGYEATTDSTAWNGTAIGRGAYIGKQAADGTTPDVGVSNNYYTPVDDDTAVEAGKETMNSTAVGFGAKSFGYQNTALGAGAEAFDTNTVAVGVMSKAIGHYANAFGKQARAEGTNSTAIGHFARALGESSMALGDYAITSTLDGKGKVNRSVALGSHARVAADNSLALGYNSLANIADDVDTEAYLSKEAFKKENGVVSVGNSEYTIGDETIAQNYRRITNVAGGAADNDAVNVAQLKVVNKKADQNATDITNLKNTVNANGKATKVTVDGEENSQDGNLKIKKTDTDGQLTYDLSLNDEITIGKDGKDGKIGINGKDGISADITVGKGEAGVDGKDGITRIIYKDEKGNHHEVATLDDGLKFKGDAGDVVIRKLNTQLDIKGGAKAEDLSDDNIGVVGTAGDNGGMAVKLSKKLKGLTSAEFKDGDNITNITAENVTITRKEGKVDLWELNKTVNNITAGTTDVSSWKLQANGANERVIKKDSVVNFKNGTNTEVTVNGNDITVDLNAATQKQINDNTTNINNIDKRVTTIENNIDQKIEGAKITVEGDTTTGVKATEVKTGDKVTGYKVSLDNKVTVGNVAIDGKDGKGEITGLTNTTVDAADFATKGRAATEEQLKAAMGKVQAQGRTTVKGSTNITVKPDTKGASEYTVELAKDITVDSVTAKTVKADEYKVGDKTYINDKGIDANGNKITNVADGVVSKDSKDAVNGSQLFATNQMVVNNMNQINNLREESREGDALGAAMAALKPLDFDPYQRNQVMAGVGYYRGKEAVALGLAHYKNEDLMIHGGLAYAGNSELMANVGVSYRFGSKDDRDIKHDRNLRMPQYAEGPISSVYILQDEVDRLTKENKEANDRIAALEAKLEKVLEKVK